MVNAEPQILGEQTLAVVGKLRERGRSLEVIFL